MSIERDMINASFDLREDGYDLSLDYYLLFSSYNGAKSYQLLNIDSTLKAYLLLYVDGEEFANLIIDKGVSHLPLQISANETLNIYVRPHESDPEDHSTSEIEIRVV